MKLNMFPGVSVNNMKNINSGYIEKCGNFLVRHSHMTKFSYFFYLFFRKFTCSGFFTFCSTSFSPHIAYIFMTRAKKKMVGVYTKTVIAFMAHAKTYRNFTNMERIRKNMRTNAPFSGSSFLKDSISIFCFSSNPIPAIIRFNDSIEKSYFNRNYISSFIFSHGAII